MDKPASTAVATSGSYLQSLGLATGAALLSLTSALAGYLLGTRWSAPKIGKRMRDRLCECGVFIPAQCSPVEVSRHRVSARHKKNMLALAGTPELVICEEVGEYRAAALQLVNSKDVVLEIGCHVGATTKVIATKAKRVVGLDQKAMLVEQARINHPHITFEIGDAFEAQQVIRLQESVRPDSFSKIFVDISGSRELSTVIRMLVMYESTLKPELIIVKSQPMKRLFLKGLLWVDHPLNKSGELADLPEPEREEESGQ
mmetsp:Transcript_49150/g.117085  ORF Transcript_49150/g.117085 Transcript_49150/m.117085 type:complete len:258 (-) Transcript_49150:92-865(-)